MLTEKLINDALRFSKTVAGTTVVYHVGNDEYKYCSFHDFVEHNYGNQNDIVYYLDNGEFLI